MFELTGTLSYVIPVMLSVLVAKTVADALEPKGIYDLVIECVISFMFVLRCDLLLLLHF
jgi:H+/Cl- antiporter ClcA